MTQQRLISSTSIFNGQNMNYLHLILFHFPSLKCSKTYLVQKALFASILPHLHKNKNTPPTIVQCKENSYYCISLLAGIKIPLFWYREWENRQASCSWWDVKTRKLTNALHQSSEKYFFFSHRQCASNNKLKKIKPVEKNDNNIVRKLQLIVKVTHYLSSLCIFAEWFPNYQLLDPNSIFLSQAIVFKDWFQLICFQIHHVVKHGNWNILMLKNGGKKQRKNKVVALHRKIIPAECLDAETSESHFSSWYTMPTLFALCLVNSN